MLHADHDDAGGQAHKQLSLKVSRASNDQAKYPRRQALVPGGQDGQLIIASCRTEDRHEVALRRCRAGQ
jgi:predicted DNA-binding helix-hairpin-helix protein